jgi:hypothetical protein
MIFTLKGGKFLLNCSISYCVLNVKIIFLEKKLIKQWRFHGSMNCIEKGYLKL